MISSTFNNSGLAAAVAFALASVWAIPSFGQPRRRKNAPMPERVEKRQLDMVVGDQVAIPTEGVAQFSEGLKGIVDVKLSDDPAKATNFVLLAIAAGETSFLLIMNDGSAVEYQIKVTARERAGAVPARDNIRLDFYFVELSEGGSYRVGLAWPGSAPDTGALQATVDIQVDTNLRTGRTVGATASIAGQVLPRIDLAQVEGWAKVMRHATLVMTNGESGSFNSGGEVNVRIDNGLSVGLDQIQHGTRVVVTPRYDKQTGRIEVKIAAEVATLAASGADGVPGRNVTSVDTLVNLELGQAVVLGGLLGESSSKDDQGLPFLSQIPVLGYLFGTHGASHERTENVLIIVPTVSDAVSADSRGMVQRALSAYGRFEGEAAGPGVMEEVSQ